MIDSLLRQYNYESIMSNFLIVDSLIRIHHDLQLKNLSIVRKSLKLRIFYGLEKSLRFFEKVSGWEGFIREPSRMFKISFNFNV